MNILFLCRLFYPHIGGVEKHVFEVSKRIIEKGHEITVITELNHNDSNHRSGQEEKACGVKVIRIPVGNNNWLKKFRIWRELWKLRKLIAASDIVHCHDVFFWYLPFRFLFPFKKVFTTFHGYEDYPLKQKNIFIHRISEKLSNGNICIGDFIKKWYGTKPSFVSYGGVGIVHGSKFMVQNKNSAVFVGRLDGQTGIKTYLEAVKLVRKKIPDFKFEIIGDGKFREEIKKDFNVLGFKKDAEKYFSKYNFAFVSRYLSILEAMVVRRLVFAVYDNPLKENYLRMAPFSEFIIISNSALELASKISFYLDNPKEKEKIVENAYAWVKKHSWKEMVDIYLKLWQM